MSRFLILFLLGLAWNFSFSQSFIKGKILDATTNETLIEAHIYLLEDWKVGAITDLNGEFELELTEEQAKGNLIISYIGYVEKTVPIEDQLEVKLEPISVQGYEVVVTAQKLISEEFKYVQFKKLDIYTNPSSKADPILAVNALPSSTTTDESANISLRGSSPAETGIFINNVPIYDAVRFSQINGIGTFSIFNTQMTKEVNVFPGNPPVEFGNATSGVVSLATDESITQKSTQSVTFSMASLGYFRNQKISNNQSLKIFTNWQPSKLLIGANKKGLPNLKWFNSNDLGAYWYGNSKNISWKIYNYNLLEQYEYRYNRPSFTGIFYQKKNRHFVVSNLNYSINAKSNLELNAGLSLGNGKYKYSNAKFDVFGRDIFVGLNYVYQSNAWNLKAGLVHNNRYSLFSGNTHKFSYAIDENHPLENGQKNTLHNQLSEAFVYWKKYFGEYLTLGLGLRKNIPTEKQKHFLTKQINLSYTKNNWSFILGAGQYFKEDISEYAGGALSAMSKQLSLDIKYNNNKFESTLSLFHKNNEVNTSNYQLTGAELFFDYHLSAKFKISQSLTYIYSDKTTNIPLFYRGYISYKPFSTWEINATSLVRSGTFTRSVKSTKYKQNLDVYQPFYEENQHRLPTYFSLGLSLSKQLLLYDTYNVVLFASLNNATNHENISGYIYNKDYTQKSSNTLSGRVFFMGAVVSF